MTMISPADEAIGLLQYLIIGEAVLLAILAFARKSWLEGATPPVITLMMVIAVVVWPVLLGQFVHAFAAEVRKSGKNRR